MTPGCGLSLFLLAGALGTAPALAVAQPVTTHPRLILQAGDLPRLRSWAVSSNPIYQNGLSTLVASAKADMDAGLIMTAANGGQTYVAYPAEMYAELFAFMSLLSGDQPTKDDYAQRARTLLMYVINQAALGEAAGQPYRDPEFATSDRSRWQGEGFPLTVDWIYSYLSATDKSTIRQVFLRWINDDLNASITTDNHPVPIGVVNDPVLVQSLQAVRFSGNNYYSAHMRNIGMMAASFDAADDPGNTLGDFVGNATGAWLYVFDNLMRNSAAGGLMPEGFEYAPQTVAYAAQLLLTLKTAGLDDAAKYGSQVVLANNPFWDQLMPAYLHSLSPAPSSNQDVGQAWLPASYGDLQNYYAADFIAPLATLALYDRITGNTARPQQIRWIETNLAPGGPSGLDTRARDSNFFSNAIFYFLLFDPSAAVPADPRPSLDPSWFAPGLGRILARTGWDANATWFTYKLSFNQVDHQTGDGNQFEFYRAGEWLTKERSGYDLDSESSLNHNTLALQNNQPARGPTDYRTIEWQLGSQWAYVSSGDPAIVAHSLSQNFVYVTGDATNLYNSTYENVTDILYASRSVMWMKPDYIVVYDRAASLTANRFKRFWLNLPTLPTVSGKLATMTTTAGQSLFVTSLLPTAATITAEQSAVVGGDVANFEPMRYRIRVDATGGPLSTRFLHVLQGADAGHAAASPVLVQSDAGMAFEGAAVAGNAVLFPVDLNVAFTATSYTAPNSVTLHRVTGLVPGAGYTVAVKTAGSNVQVSITAGGISLADSGGVLEFSSSGTTGGTAQNIIFAPPANVTLGLASFVISAAASSGLDVIFEANGTAVCTVLGAKVSLTGVGICSITASQPGNSTYAAAAPVTRTFTVSAAGIETVAAFLDQKGAPALTFNGSTSFPDAGGFLIGAPGIAQDLSGNTYIVGLDSAGGVHLNSYSSAKSAWNGWQYSGGILDTSSGLTAAVDPSGVVWFTGRDIGDRYWINSWNGTSFGGWILVANGILSHDSIPQIAIPSDGTIYVVGKDIGGRIWSDSYNPTTQTFTGWVDRQAVMIGQPSVTAGQDGMVYVSVRSVSTNSPVYITQIPAQNAATANTWLNGGGQIDTDPQITSQGGTVYLLAEAANNTVYLLTFSESTQTFGAWNFTNGILNDATIAAAAGNVFVAGRDSENRIYWYSLTGNSWFFAGGEGVSSTVLAGGK